MSDPVSQSERRKGLAIAIAGSAGVGLNAVTAKYAQQELGTLTFVPLWFLTAWICTSIYLGARRIPLLAPLGKHWKPLVGIGLLHAASAVCGFHGLHLLDPTVASFFTRTSVLFTWLLGLLVMREKPGRLAAVGTVTAVIGVAVLSYATGAKEPFGVALCLASALLMALGILVGKRVAGEASTGLTVWVRAATITVVIGTISIATGQFHIVPSWPHLTVLALGAVVGPFASQFLFFYSLQRIALSEAGIVRATTPIFVAVYSLIFLRMFPTAQQLASGAIVVAGILILSLARPVEQQVPRG